MNIKIRNLLIHRLFAGDFYNPVRYFIDLKSHFLALRVSRIATEKGDSNAKEVCA